MSTGSAWSLNWRLWLPDMDRLSVAFTGNLEKVMKAELDKSEKAVTLGVRRRTTFLKDTLRRQVRVAGLGEGVAKAWRDRVYPKGGNSLDAAGVVFSKAPHIVEAFDKGQTIRSPNGFWLAIPTENAPKRVGRKRITPSNFPENRFGPLRFVFLKGRRDLALLVVDTVRKRKGKRGGFAKASKAAVKRGDFEDSVPMFWLVPRVKARKKLSVSRATFKAESGLPREILRAFAELDAKDAAA